MQNPLGAEHDALRKIMREFGILLDAPLPDDMAHIQKIRMEFSRLFRGHIVAERDYAQHCLTSADKAVHKLMEAHARCFHELYFDYSHHVHHWPTDRIREDWWGYGQSVRALQRRLLDLLAWEDREILPALAATA
ncbi:MAG: hypothetical protein AB7E05_03945 [Sphingobium sp.]